MTHEEYQTQCDEALDRYLDHKYGRITMIDEMHQLRDVYVTVDDMPGDTLAARIAPYGHHTEDDGA